MPLGHLPQRFVGTFKIKDKKKRYSEFSKETSESEDIQLNPNFNTYDYFVASGASREESTSRLDPIFDLLEQTKHDLTAAYGGVPSVKPLEICSLFIPEVAAFWFTTIQTRIEYGIKNNMLSSPQIIQLLNEFFVAQVPFKHAKTKTIVRLQILFGEVADKHLRDLENQIDKYKHDSPTEYAHCWKHFKEKHASPSLLDNESLDDLLKSLSCLCDDLPFSQHLEILHSLLHNYALRPKPKYMVSRELIRVSAFVIMRESKLYPKPDLFQSFSEAVWCLQNELKDSPATRFAFLHGSIFLAHELYRIMGSDSELVGCDYHDVLVMCYSCLIDNFPQSKDISYWKAKHTIHEKRYYELLEKQYPEDLEDCSSTGSDHSEEREPSKE